MRKILTIVAAACCAVAFAQEPDEAVAAKKTTAFGHLDLALTLGTTGVGFDVATPVNDYIQLRAGFAFMPQVDYRMNFGIESFDSDGNLIVNNYASMAEKVEQFIGFKVDDNVDMIGKPTYYNFKLLVDVTPFRNKNWHFTAGFHWGPSQIAEAYNTTEDMQTLVGVGIYNNMYDKIINGEPMFTVGETSVWLPEQLESRVLDYGRMAIHVGDYKDTGKPYLMEPDEQSMVRCKVRVNSFKPYLGFGYGGRLVKGSDKYHVSFDAGLMFWGGTPSIITHDGTNLARDVENIGGKVGDYVDAISSVKVFPVLNFRIARRLF